MAGIELLHVPYRGGAAVMPDLMAGRIHMTFATVPSSLPFVKAGRLKALAVANTTRSPSLPEVPTLAEAALPGYDANNWMGLFVRGGTPRALVDRLHAQLRALVIGTPLADQLLGLGFEPVVGTPAQFDRIVRDELIKWRKVIVASGAKGE